jgi:hypothetical protein
MGLGTPKSINFGGTHQNDWMMVSNGIMFWMFILTSIESDCQEEFVG